MYLVFVVGIWPQYHNSVKEDSYMYSGLGM